MTEPASNNAPSAGVPVWKNPFAIAFAIGVLTITAYPFVQRAVMRAPPPLTSLGAWQLTDDTGHAFGSQELKGKVWIASFFFTRCPSVCPGQQRSFGNILDHTDDLGDGVRLVSFTVDPAYDTPPVLEAYAKKMAAPRQQWKFVTGSDADMHKLLVETMRVPVGKPEVVTPAKDGAPEIIDIAHTAKFALVDQNGDLRGFWGVEEKDRGNLINAARMLVKYGPAP